MNKKYKSNNIFIKQLLQSGQVTFTTEGREFLDTLYECKHLGIETRIRRFSTFVVIVKHKMQECKTKSKNQNCKGEQNMKNWTVREAAKVIREGKDQEAIKEIAKHFPLFAMIVAAGDFDGLANAMPDKITVRKIENELNSGDAVEDDAEDQNDGADDASDDKDGAQDLASMSKNELIALCEKKGIKVQKYQKPKQYYIDALSKATSDKDVDDEVDDEVDEGEEDDPIALYKQCKKAGLKVAPKKSAKYYKDALKKAEQAAEDADDEDWDDDDAEDQEEEKPAKGSKGSKSGSSAKGTKSPSKGKAKAEPEDEDDDDDDGDDDDEDWDI